MMEGTCDTCGAAALRDKGSFYKCMSCGVRHYPLDGMFDEYPPKEGASQDVLQLMEFFRELRGGEGRRIPARQYAGRIMRDIASEVPVPWTLLQRQEGFEHCTQKQFFGFCSGEFLGLRSN